MNAKLPIATQAQILKLERRVFKLEQKIVSLKATHEVERSRLKAENQKLRDHPIVMNEERRAELMERMRRHREQEPKRT